MFDARTPGSEVDVDLTQEMFDKDYKEPRRMTPPQAPPTPPRSPARTASVLSGRPSTVRSGRSSASLARLADRHLTGNLTNLIQARCQVIANQHLPASFRTHGKRMANTEAMRMVREGWTSDRIRRAGLSVPSNYTNGFFANGGELADSVDASAESVIEALKSIKVAPKPPSTPRPASTRSEALQPKPPTPADPVPMKKRLPPVTIAGKEMPLETLLRDKIMQKGAGGAHQLRKAFKIFDKDLNGKIDVDEFQVFLEECHIKVNKSTIQRFFDKWLSGHDGITGTCDHKAGTKYITYNDFVKAILPPDYPTYKNEMVANIASMARNMGSEHTTLREKLAMHQTVASWEQHFQDKISQKSAHVSDRSRIFKQFDRTNKGYTTFDDLIKAADIWNIHATDKVKELLRERYVCKPENLATGKIDYYDYIGKVLPPDFKDPAQVIQEFRTKMENNFLNLQKAFLDVDEDHSGTITIPELMDKCMQWGIETTPDVLARIVKSFDADGDGEITFEEFSHALINMDPQDFMKGQVTHQVKGLWDPDQQEKRRRELIGRPPTQASMQSIDSAFNQDDVDLQNQWENRHDDRHAGVQVDAARMAATGQVEFFTQAGNRHDIIDMCRDRIYRKTGSGNEMRRAFHRFDPDGNGRISCYEFGSFLRQLNLNLSPAALRQLVREFDADGDGYVDFSEFCQLVVPKDYHWDPAQPEQHQGVHRLTSDRTRRIDRVMTPRLHDVDAAAGEVDVSFLPDPVLLVRDKILARSTGVNDGFPARQLRNVFRLYDSARCGGIPDPDFKRVLHKLNVYVNDRAFAHFSERFRFGADKGGGGGTKIDYDRFMRAVLQREISAGFGPHVPKGAFGRSQGTWVTTTPRALGATAGLAGGGGGKHGGPVGGRHHASGAGMISPSQRFRASEFHASAARPGTAGQGKMYEGRVVQTVPRVSGKIGQPLWDAGGRHPSGIQSERVSGRQIYSR